MRTPLSILRVHIAVLRDTPPGSAEAMQSIDDIDKGAARLSHLISQLLALARADNAVHADDLSFEIVDLRDIVAAVVDEHRDAAAGAGVTFVIASETRELETRTSVGLAIELLSNLIDNAIRHGGPGGFIRIGVIDGPGIIVEDDGPGIPQEQREHVFTRFVRLRRHIPNEGSGLGLSIARSLAQAIGAEIELGDAHSGSGLRVVVRFPPLAQP
jgi:two-component system sensor histidine kinase TctE